MHHPLELFIGLRFLKARRRNQFVSFISMVSLVGVAMGVAALIVVLSVMNGFEEEIRERILGMTAHGAVVATDGELGDWQAVRERALSEPYVEGAAPFVAGEVMLASGPRLSPAQVRGVLPELEITVSDVADKLRGGVLGDLAAGSQAILLGRNLAAALAVAPGDPLLMLVARPGSQRPGIPRVRQFRVAGIIEAGHFEYDQSLALVHSEDAARALELKPGVTGVRIKVDDIYDAPRHMQSLLQSLDATAGLAGKLTVSDWTQEHVTYFRAIRMEKTVMFIILTLIVAVAAFNILASLVMVVMDKRADIGILRTLGLEARRVMGAFVAQGVAVGLLGTLIGVLLGVLLAANVETLVPFLERSFNFKLFPGDVFYISEVPSRLEVLDVAVIGLAAFVLTSLSTLYPAWRASRIQPVDALRYD